MEPRETCKWTRNILDELDINPKIKVQAKKAGYVSARSILGASQEELEMKLDTSSFHIRELIEAAASYMLPKHHSAWDLSQSGEEEPKYLTTGCQHLDGFLGGGMPLKGITEVAGKGGSGKTQFALQLSLCAQLPPAVGGLGKGVVYISTGARFPSQRLQQMVKHFKDKYSQGPASYTDNIFLYHCHEMDILLHCIQYQLPFLLSQRPVGLVIIDSVAAPFRSEDNIYEKKNALQTLGHRLHHLAETFGTAVVTINQVRDDVGNDLLGDETSVVPTMGLTWSNLVTTRFMISRTATFAHGETESSVQQLSGKMVVEYNIRQLEVIFCPWMKKQSCPFVVTDKGIEDVE